tara:strand:- start:848 stop:1087 length:240 start_codon:yes stop_codon:yes gene_type:complete
MVLTTNSFNGNGEEQSSPLKLMKITLLRNTRIDGEFVAAGKTAEINDRDGKYLIANGIATESKNSKAKKDKSTKDLETR